MTKMWHLGTARIAADSEKAARAWLENHVDATEVTVTVESSKAVECVWPDRDWRPARSVRGEG